MTGSEGVAPYGSERLDGRVAVVTGASAGIGEATAVALAAAGASVVITARREERLESLAERIRDAGGTALPYGADVASLEDVQGLAAATLEAFGRVDILVNNAGLMPLAPMEEVRIEEWSRMVDVNVKGVLHCIAAFLPTMIEQHSGHVVNIGSLAGRRPFPGGTVYSATKFAVRSLSWGMHLELGAKHGIRVTDIQPGFVSTELMDAADPELKKNWDEAWKGRRTLQPEDVARATMFAVTSPEHVSVSEVLVRPVDQAT